MTTPEPRPVFDFDDPAAYLRERFAHAQKRNPRFSLRAFAKRFALAHPALLAKVIRGERALTPSFAVELLPALGLVGPERRYFELLVLGASARTESERALYSRMLAELRAGRGNSQESPDRDLFIASDVEIWSECGRRKLRDEWELRHITFRPSEGTTTETVHRIGVGREGEPFFRRAVNRTRIEAFERHRLVAGRENCVGELMSSSPWNWQSSYFTVQYKDEAGKPELYLSGQDIYSPHGFSTRMRFADLENRDRGFLYRGDGEYVSQGLYEDSLAKLLDGAQNASPIQELTRVSQKLRPRPKYMEPNS